MIPATCPCNPTDENKSTASAVALALHLNLAPSVSADHVFNIPIVFNCCGNLAQASDPNITDSQLEEQVHQLNLDFRALNHDYTLDCPSNMLNVRSGDCKINFYIQDIRRRFTSELGSDWHCHGWTGNPSKAVGHKTLGKSVFDSMKTARYGLVAHQPELALNVWVAWHSDDGTPSMAAASTAGYADFPNGSSPFSHPHVVVQAGSIGSVRSPAPSPYSSSDQKRGRVLVHEAGHFLGLWHSWGESNASLGSCGRDPDCPDLPLAAGPCGWEDFSPPAILDRGCPDTGEPYNNHMNYGDYGSSFTPDQKSVMRTFPLYNSHALIGTSLRPFKTSETTAVSVGSSSAAKVFFGSTKVWEAGAVTGLLALPGYSRVTLSWIAPFGGFGFAQYVVRHKLSASQDWITQNTGSTSTTYVVSGLTAGAQYDFAVATKSSTGAVGAWSAAVSVTLPPGPPNLEPLSAGLVGSGAESDPLRTEGFLTGTFNFRIHKRGVYAIAGEGNSIVATQLYYRGRAISMRSGTDLLQWSRLTANGLLYEVPSTPLDNYFTLSNTRISSVYWMGEQF
jgi:hypothetical protein